MHFDLGAGMLAHDLVHEGLEDLAGNDPVGAALEKCGGELPLEADRDGQVARIVPVAAAHDAQHPQPGFPLAARSKTRHRRTVALVHGSRARGSRVRKPRQRSPMSYGPASRLTDPEPRAANPRRSYNFSFPMIVAKRFFVSGRVQGVGFRYFVQDHAAVEGRARLRAQPSRRPGRGAGRGRRGIGVARGARAAARAAGRGC